MRHRVAAKRVIAAEIRTALAALPVPFDGLSVHDMLEDTSRHTEAVLLRVTSGFSEAQSQQSSVLHRSDQFSIEIGIVVNEAGQDGRDAEDRCAEIGDTISRLLADRTPIHTAVVALNQTQTAWPWTLHKLQIISEEGPDPVIYGDEGVSSYASITVDIVCRLGGC
jgi:hypothetical protein